jgi:hypothetical protein
MEATIMPDVIWEPDRMGVLPAWAVDELDRYRVERD